MAKRYRLLEPAEVKLRPSHVKPGGCKFYRAGDEFYLDEDELERLGRLTHVKVSLVASETPPKKAAAKKKAPTTTAED